MKLIRGISLFLLVINHMPNGNGIPPPPANVSVETIMVAKCCQENEIMYNNYCHNINRTGKLEGNKLWKPRFTDDSGQHEIKLPSYTIVSGIPTCGSRQQWTIFEEPQSRDKILLLKDGVMRHIASKTTEDQDSLEETRSFDYAIGQYCIDKVIYDDYPYDVKYALVCRPKINGMWHEPDFIIRRILGPISHGICICCFITIAVVYFVLPQLCDLVGNIITTISLCLVLAEIAEIVRIFTEYNSRSSYLVADSVMYFSIMASFFWLNGFGYYIWKSFRSRNVFLRTTDGKKYCYYSLYAWSATFGLGFMALVAHLFLDISKPNDSPDVTEGAIGLLGISVFFIPISLTIIANVFFCLSTMDIMKRMSTYGRIHLKLKYNFQLFMKFFVIMTSNWLIFTLTWLSYDVVCYLHIFSNALQALTMIYVSVVDLKRVRFLIRKACCYDKCIFRCCRPDENTTDVAEEWGEEMLAMNDE